MNPTRSTKTIETTRRSSEVRPGSASGAPHALQKLAPSGFSCPQRAQVSIEWNTRVRPRLEEGAVPETTFDAERAEAFAGRMLDLLNSGALAVMISVGHRTGLFDALADLGEATSQALADAAGLDERYVREWLGALTAGRIVEVEPETARYRLPAEHAAWLTRAASPDNLAVEAQWITQPLNRRGRHRRVLPKRRRGAVRALLRVSTR